MQSRQQREKEIRWIWQAQALDALQRFHTIPQHPHNSTHHCDSLFIKHSNETLATYGSSTAISDISELSKLPNISQPICWQWNDMERISWDFTMLRGSNRWFSEVWHFVCNWEMCSTGSEWIWLHLTHKSRGCITSRSASMIAGIWDDLVLWILSMSSWHWWRCANQSFDS